MSVAVRTARNGAVYAGLGILLVLVLFPYVWVFLSSFKPTVEIFAVPPTILPRAPSLDNYLAAIGTAFAGQESESTLPQTFRNSLVIASVATVWVMLLAILAGYSFARIRFRFRTPLLLLILGLRMLPAIVMVVPVYILIQRLGLLNTPWALILVYSAFQAPFAIWLLSVFFQDIAQELEDAARVDGCGRLGVLFRIVAPLTLPQIAVVAIFVFLGCWNDFLVALVLTSTEGAQTMPVGLAGMQTSYEIRWGIMTAGAIIHSIPAIVFVLVAQRYIVSGMTLGAIKG
jgi:multiple sugar transport system permease protein